MKTLASSRLHATRTWGLLIATTGLAWWLAERGALSPRIATGSVLVIAAFKVRLVFLHFMELRSAPTLWRLLFEAWVLLVVGALAAGCWAGMR